MFSGRIKKLLRWRRYLHLTLPLVICVSTAVLFFAFNKTSLPVIINRFQKNNDHFVVDSIELKNQKQIHKSDQNTNEVENEVNNNEIETEFKKQYFRMQKRRIDWQQILAPCANNTVVGRTLPGWGKENETSLKESYVDYMEIRPAGEFSRFFIRTKTKNGTHKTIGGDFWKVILFGRATVAATVFDHGNGSYEAIALIVDPGKYSLVAIIERSLCEGMKDPAPGFYSRLVSLERRNIHPVIYGKEPGCCLNGRLAQVNFTVLPSMRRDNVEKRIEAVLKSNCASNCSFIWLGLGRWIGNEWKPFLSSDNHRLRSLSQTNQQNKETIYFLGGSVTVEFSNAYFHHRKAYNVCDQVWKRCAIDIFHLYPRGNLDLHPNTMEYSSNVTYNELKTYGNATVEFKPKIILDAVKEVLRQPEMNSRKSLLVLNLNVHYTKRVSFSQYKDLIGNLMYILKNREKLLGSKSRVVWRTSTALNYRGIFDRLWSSKYLTSDRSLLFGAYALSEVCKSGIDVLDWYPMSMATPSPKDRVHFKPVTFFKAMDALTWYTLAGVVPRTRKICFAP